MTRGRATACPPSLVEPNVMDRSRSRPETILRRFQCRLQPLGEAYCRYRESSIRGSARVGAACEMMPPSQAHRAMADLRILPSSVSRIAQPAQETPQRDEQIQRLGSLHRVANLPPMAARMMGSPAPLPARADCFPVPGAPLTVRNVQAHTAALESQHFHAFGPRAVNCAPPEPSIDYQQDEGAHSAAPPEPAPDYWGDGSGCPPEPEVDYPLDDVGTPGVKGILREPGSATHARAPHRVHFSNAAPLDVLLQFSSKGGSRGSYTAEQQGNLWNAAVQVPYTAKAATQAVAQWQASAGRLPPLAVLDAILNPSAGRR